jgi:hypothetical protein
LTSAIEAIMDAGKELDQMTPEGFVTTEQLHEKYTKDLLNSNQIWRNNLKKWRNSGEIRSPVHWIWIRAYANQTRPSIVYREFSIARLIFNKRHTDIFCSRVFSSNIEKIAAFLPPEQAKCLVVLARNTPKVGKPDV